MKPRRPGSLGIIHLLAIAAGIGFTLAFVATVFSVRTRRIRVQAYPSGRTATATPDVPASTGSVQPAVQSGVPTPMPHAVTPTVVPKPYGIARTYTVSSGETKTVCRITGVTIDPVYPRGTDPQKFSVTIQNASAVRSVNVTIRTDRKISTYPVTMTDSSATRQTWSGTWTLPDTNDYVYSFAVTATETSGMEQTVQIPFR